MENTIWSGDAVTITPPSLPSGNISPGGMAETVAGAGADGMATANIPLAVCSGRGTAPSCSLYYSSASGNGESGIGWSLQTVCISRSTLHGVPRYQDDDIFLGPDGGELTEYRDDNGLPEVRSNIQICQGITLEQSYTVRRYRAQTENNYERIECWTGETDKAQQFWLIYHSDGAVTCFGHSADARVADETDPLRISEWYQEEFLAVNGEHICFHYRREDDAGAGDEERRGGNNRLYPQRTDYANVNAHGSLYCLAGDMPTPEAFLLHIVFDYGERTLQKAQVPPWTVASESGWLLRRDPFSLYSAGFETRCRRLCRQILMFSRKADDLKRDPVMVNRYLFGYTESPVMTCLSSITRLAYEMVDGALRVAEKPPVVFTYTDAKLTTGQSDYVPLMNWPEVDRGTGLLVDLYGEGYAGWLSRHESVWGYQAPVRSEVTPDGTEYADWQPLPLIPSEQGDENLLADINGDGFPEWVILRPDLNGFFTLNTQQEKTGFTPFSAFPSEFFHPQSQFADLACNGLMGIALIGPHTVRFYANNREGFEPAVITCNDECLPLPSSDAREWVALADPLGSGGGHLTRIRYNSVTCWPGNGYGQFGKAVELHLPGEIDKETQFRPQHLYMTDIDGSGTDDLLYATPAGLNYYRNLSGNGFAEPLLISWPDDFAWDDLNTLQFAALSGQGVSLVVSERHMKARHWRLNLTSEQPWLLKTITNHCGFYTQLSYRSSADYWLDEKLAEPSRRSQLPLRLSLLSGIHRRDLITRQERHTTYCYRGGRYDTDKRRYCGYYRVDETDACGESNNRNDTPLQRPRLLRRWYHTGAVNDAVKRTGYFSSPVTSDSLLTGWRDNKDQIVADSTAPSLHYALKGALLREELFDSEDTAVPFSVQEHRYQVRLLQQNGDVICAAPLLLETLSINYQRSEKDIACQQHIVMDYSEFGEALHEITVFLPRQSGSEENPYPAVTPLQWQNSFDDAQTLCWFTETRRRSLSMITPDRWLPVLPECNWQESASLTGSEMNGNTLFSREILQAEDSPLSGKSRTLLAWQKECYQQDGADINYPPRITGHEQAVFNETTLQPYRVHISDDELTQQLNTAGYKKRTPEELDQSVWISSGNTLTYLEAEGFYLPAESKNVRGGVQIFHYNTYYRTADCFTDEFGQKTQVTDIDERFWQPVSICDINNNISEVRLNAFGNIVAASQYGTEEGKATGFKPVSEFIPPEPLTLTQAIEKSEALLSGLSSVTLYHENELTGDNPLPAWMMTISASDYPGTPDMAPCAIDITYFDGAGHPRQQFSQDVPGPAYPCADGVLLQDDNQLKEVMADTRWRIMPEPETTLSGNIIRRFRPWFSDHCDPVIDIRLSDLIPCEITGYDAQNKPVFVQDAEGYLRYQRYFPWFNLAYDENDTISSGFDLLRLFQRQTNISAASGNRDSLCMERGIYGQMTEIDKPDSEKRYADNIQRYYFNGGRETWLPDAGITLTPGRDILRPYAMPQVWYGDNDNDN
ncbi:SpvB/TcaC N-terminal domain-containing protein [Morganella psychrotolerans]|nr:SpvB/TcaC N-terminal domain-containing protein [Morganella psychrotolerans]